MPEEMAEAYELTDMSFDEVSLVKRGANQESKVVLWKSDDVSKSCDHKGLKKGQKCPECGKESASPMGSTGVFGKEDVAPTAVLDEPSTVTPDRSTDQENEMPEATAEMAPDTAEYISGLEAQVIALTAALNDATSTLEKMADPEEPEPDEDDIIKSADPRVRQLIAKAQADADEARKEAAIAGEIAKAERDQRVTKEFIEKAATLSKLPVKATEFGPVLKSLSEKLNEQEFQTVWSLLSAANEGMSQGSIFSEFGKSTANPSEPGTPLEEIAKKAGANGPVDLVALAKSALENPDLYEQHRRSMINGGN